MVKNERDISHFRKTPEDWEFTDKHGIPIIRGIKLNTEKELQLTPFNLGHTIAKTKRKDKIIHFFLADYLFERTWTKLDSTTEFLKNFKGVLSPDFSIYTDMPYPIQLYNHYRKMWISRWYQSQGIKVIPTACWSDEASYDFCFEGMPKHSCIAVSSVGIVRNKQANQLFVKGYNKMIETLEPKQIIWYGKELDCMDRTIPHIIHEPIHEERFRALREKQAMKENNE